MTAGERPTNLNPEGLGPARGFSHVTVAAGMVWVAGQIGSDASGALVEPADVVAQFGRAIRNVAMALQAAGCGPEDTVKLTFYVTDIPTYKQNLKAIGEAYRGVFGRHYPATTLVEVSALFEREAMVEIEAVAVQPR